MDAMWVTCGSDVDHKKRRSLEHSAKRRSKLHSSTEQTFATLTPKAWPGRVPCIRLGCSAQETIHGKTKAAVKSLAKLNMS